MTEINVSEQPRILNELIEGLRQASGGCSQLTHALGDPRWMMIRECVDLTQEGVLSLATFAASKVSTVKPR